MTGTTPETTGESTVRVEFCGEWYDLDPARDFHVGREADLVVDENPYLHRRFLRLHEEQGLWWIANVGSVLTATVSDRSGRVQAWLAPGARLPIVFPEMVVLFSAGSTTYEFTIHGAGKFFTASAVTDSDAGATTIAPVPLTSSQRLLIVALAEGILRQSSPGRGEISPSATVAERLGWSMTTFNRKLDNVCDKLDKLGVDGLRGGRGKLATNRRLRLVEYAIATRLVSKDDLWMLDRNDEQVHAAAQPSAD